MDYSTIERHRYHQAIEFARETCERSRRIIEKSELLLGLIRSPFLYPRLVPPGERSQQTAEVVPSA